MEVVEILQLELMNIAYILFQFQYNITYPLRFVDPTDSIDLCVVPWV